MVPKPFSRRRFLLASLVGGAFVLRGRALPASAQMSPLPADPMLAAEELSRLETTEHIPALYTFYEHLHPDAKAIVPRFAVIGWYKADFQPRVPQPAISTGVVYRDDWAWGVNGVTYPGVAEVSYTQTFGAGTVENDEVRLAPYNGGWTWFFGNSREWVDGQIARFDQRNQVMQDGEAPYQLHFAAPFTTNQLTHLPEITSVADFPGRMIREPLTEAPLADYAAARDGFTYKAEREPYTLGYATIETLNPGLNAADVIDSIVYRELDRPPFTLRAWNLTPPSGYPWALYESMGNDAIGFVQTLVVCDGASVLTLSGVSDDLIKTFAQAIS